MVKLNVEACIPGSMFINRNCPAARNTSTGYSKTQPFLNNVYFCGLTSHCGLFYSWL